MAKSTLRIEGMSCAHCARHVKEALEELEGVNEAVVDLEGKTATVEYGGSATVEAMTAAVEEAGYRATY